MKTRNICVKKFDAYSKKCDAGIILYCADETCHYVAFERRGRKQHFYNDIYGKENDIRTMDAFMSGVKFNMAYLFVINR